MPTAPGWIGVGVAAAQGMLGRGSFGLWGASDVLSRPPRRNPGCKDALGQTEDQTFQQDQSRAQRQGC